MVYTSAQIALPLARADARSTHSGATHIYSVKRASAQANGSAIDGVIIYIYISSNISPQMGKDRASVHSCGCAFYGVYVYSTRVRRTRIRTSKRMRVRTYTSHTCIQYYVRASAHFIQSAFFSLNSCIYGILPYCTGFRYLNVPPPSYSDLPKPRREVSVPQPSYENPI